jgi:hypothetical protein
MPLVVVSHPIALNDDIAIIKKADGAVDEVVSTLVGNDGRTAAQRGR